jgi:hypothetical protein
MATTSQPDDTNNNVVAFPKHGGKSPTEQLNLVRAAKATAILAAIIGKYGTLPITIDEIDNGRNYRPYIAYQPLTNSWSLSTQHKDQHGPPTFPTTKTGQQS